MRILLVTWDGAGSLTPTLALISALHARGHEVIVLAHDSQQPEITSAGGQFRRYPAAPQFDQGKPQPAFDFNLWFEGFNAAAARDVLDEIPRVQPDVLIIDCMMGITLQATRSIKIKQVALVHGVYSVMAPFAEAIAAADLALGCSYSAFDVGATFPKNMAFIGPIRPAVTGQPWTRKLPDRPLIVASVSTGHQGSFQPGLLQRVCDALSALPVEGLVTTGRGISPTELTAAPNVTIERNLDHTLTLPGASLFITHCGHGSVMAALRAAVPMLCLPPIADQPHNALLVEELGLGQLVSVVAQPGVIANTATRLLANTEMHAKAKAFANDHTFEPNSEKAVDLIEALTKKKSFFATLFGSKH